MPSSTSSSERGQVPHRRLPRVRGLAPLFTGLASFVLAVGAWLLLIEPRLPPPLQRQSNPPGKLGWYVGGRRAFYLKGSARAEGWLALGDSRVNQGLDEVRLAQLGIEPLAVLWVGAGQLGDMLEAARELPPRRLLVALSPMSVYRRIQDPEQERARTLAFMNRPWSRRVDDAIDEQFVRLRSSVVNWIDTRGFVYGWREMPNPGASDRRFLGALEEPTRQERARAFEALAQKLRELRGSGRDIVCVRWPISPSLREIEDTAFDPALFGRMCAELSIPYHDLGTSEPTLDGSHLTAEGARHLASRLAVLLK